MTQETRAWIDDQTEEIAPVQPEADPSEDQLLADDDFLPETPQRTSRLTLLLAAALLLAVGFVLGVQVQKLFGG